MTAQPGSRQKVAVVAAIDFFIHSRLTDSPDLLTRARFLVLMLLSGCLVYALILGWYFLSPSPEIDEIALFVVFVNLCTATGLLFLLRQRGLYAICGGVAVVQGWLNIFLIAVISGGSFTSSILQLLSIVCVMAFFLGGIFWGLVCAIFSMIAVAFLSLLQISGTQLPQLVSVTSFPFAQSLLLPINLGMMTMMAAVYEISYASVKRQRDIERDKYLKLAATDPLTGLANRRMFDETLAARIALYEKFTPVRQFALCYLDLDQFKPINDEFGHGVGDEVLNTISTRLRLALRGADFIGRHGGDEFLMLLDSVHDAAAAQALSKRFLQLVQEPITTSVGVMQVGGSFGFALFPQHGTDIVSLQKAADEAMYEAKRQRCGYYISGSAGDFS